MDHVSIFSSLKLVSAAAVDCCYSYHPEKKRRKWRKCNCVNESCGRAVKKKGKCGNIKIYWLQLNWINNDFNFRKEQTNKNQKGEKDFPIFIAFYFYWYNNTHQHGPKHTENINLAKGKGKFNLFKAFKWKLNGMITYYYFLFYPDFFGSICVLDDGNKIDKLTTGR